VPAAASRPAEWTVSSVRLAMRIGPTAEDRRADDVVSFEPTLLD